MKKQTLTLITILVFSFGAKSQCIVNPNNVLAYSIGTKTFGIVKEAKTWPAARACAVQFSGRLAVVESQLEQDSIFAFLNRSSILNSSTTAPDGGGAAYVWLGGNDRGIEGTWVWDNYGIATGQFWMGARTGSVVGGLYNNWGNEPDNFQNQDALGLALSSWPFGTAGQWNDVDESNNLYFIVEYPGSVGIDEVMMSQVAQLSPNPAKNYIHINCEFCERNETYKIFDVNGRLVQKGALSASKRIAVKDIARGSYIVTLTETGLSLKFQKD
ncbi:MAG: T9SS type A sorting domain-containing protein [Flavobacteriales bacterium]|nr:T9SS type A sorting domain-containing protein [Flavobacteriales bacterium]